MKTVEIKNDKGQVTERYNVVKKNNETLKNGLYERFDEEGKLAEQSNYKMGKLEGIRKIYEKGVLESEETRVDNEYNGLYKAYYSDGHVRMEATYVKDVMTGDVKSYYPSGKLKEIVRFANNEEDGPFTEYYENGKLKAEGQYKQLDDPVDGKYKDSNSPVEDGELKLYDSTGVLIRIMDCKMGKCETKWFLEAQSH